MKFVETERVFCIEITERQMRIAMRKDDRVSEKYDVVSGKYSYPNSLTDQVCAVAGVREVHFDPMFGAAVHVRVESEDAAAMATTLENVKKVIAKYVR